MEDWKSDWKSFVDAVGEAYSEGLDDAAVTARFMQQPVTWLGKVTDKRLDDDPGVEMEMETVEVALADGRRSTVNYLFAKMSQSDAMSWKSVENGTLVKFSTTIAKGHAPFSGIQWSELDESRGVVLLATENSALVDVVEAPQAS